MCKEEEGLNLVKEGEFEFSSLFIVFEIRDLHERVLKSTSSERA